MGSENCDFIGVSQQYRALTRKTYSPRGTIKEPDTEIVFERLDLQCHRGLCQKQVLRRFAETEMLGDSAKNLEAKILQLSHGSFPSLSTEMSANGPGIGQLMARECLSESGRI
jgi:hypothetical protein